MNITLNQKVKWSTLQAIGEKATLPSKSYTDGVSFSWSSENTLSLNESLIDTAVFQAELDKLDIDAEVAQGELEEILNTRASQYPSIGDQLDALYHAGVFPAEMAAQIQAVKDKYPKGGAV